MRRLDNKVAIVTGASKWRARAAAAVGSPLLRGQCARSRRLQCGDLLQALALRIMSALRTLRVGAPTRRIGVLLSPHSHYENNCFVLLWQASISNVETKPLVSYS
jgi:hypothetical protein